MNPVIFRGYQKPTLQVPDDPRGFMMCVVVWQLSQRDKEAQSYEEAGLTEVPQVHDWHSDQNGV